MLDHLPENVNVSEIPVSATAPTEKPKKPTSEKQIEANRRNAQKSTGPKSEEGKKAVSGNATTHGLTAQKPENFANDDPTGYEASLARWVAQQKPEDDMQLALVESACRAAWKLRRAGRYEEATVATRVRHAELEYERTQMDRALRLGMMVAGRDRYAVGDLGKFGKDAEDVLKYKFHGNPSEVVRELESFKHGADWLMERWRQLHQILMKEGFWHRDEKYEVLRLMGHRLRDVLNEPHARELFMNMYVAHPDKWELSDELAHAIFGDGGNGPYLGRIHYMKTELPGDWESAIWGIQRLVKEELDQLEEHMKTLDEIDALDRAEVGRRAEFEATSEMAMLIRYESASHRQLIQSNAALEKSRAQHARSAASAPRPQPQAPPPPAEPVPTPPAPPKTSNAHGRVLPADPFAKQTHSEIPVFATVRTPNTFGPSPNGPPKS